MKKYWLPYAVITLFIFTSVYLVISTWGKTGKQAKVINGTNDKLDHWQHRHFEGRSYWIAWSLLYESPDNSSRELFLFVNNKDFTMDYVKQLFEHLSTEFSQPHYLQITAFDDKEIVQNSVWFRQRIKYVYFPPTPKGYEDLEKERNAATPPTGYLRAYYQRSEHEKTLHYSPEANERNLVTVQISSNVTGNSQSLFQQLRYAIRKDNIFELKKILAKLGNVNSKDENGWTPLMLSVRYGNPRIAKLLLDSGSGLKSPTTLALAVEAREDYFVGKQHPVANDNNESPIPEEKMVECVQLLLDKGARINTPIINGETALMHATHSKKIVELLCRYGADINAKSTFGWTALMYASHYGHTESVKLMLQNGADARVVSNDGWTALRLAEANGNTELAAILRTSVLK